MGYQRRVHGISKMKFAVLAIISAVSATAASTDCDKVAMLVDTETCTCPDAATKPMTCLDAAQAKVIDAIGSGSYEKKAKEAYKKLKTAADRKVYEAAITAEEATAAKEKKLWDACVKAAVAKDKTKPVIDA